MKLFVIYERYYDFSKGERLVGGIQTYLSKLMPLFQARGVECYVYQAGDQKNVIDLDDVHVYSVPVGGASDSRNSVQTIYNEVRKLLNIEKDILLFGTDCFMCKNDAKRSIAIQHGITWDRPQHVNYSDNLNALYAFRKAINTYQVVKRLNYVNRIVCVDYNFINWYRASIAHETIKYNVIPNFTPIAPKIDKGEKVRIIFARRFEQYRGTRVFANAAKRILNEYPDIEITIAGRGPDKEYLVKEFNEFDNVIITEYKSEESMDMHANKSIAVVPTIGSEGTSLSLLEAMSSQCAVIATNVGGMTNIILDGYNGILINPGDANALYSSLRKLIDDRAYRMTLSENAYQTAKNAFSYDKWKRSWEQVIEDVCH
jgi:glycosyltransferase involved in cell wall biosynthesis